MMVIFWNFTWKSRNGQPWRPGSEAETAQSPSGDGLALLPGAADPSHTGLCPQLFLPSPPSPTPIILRSPALHLQSLGEGLCPYRVLSPLTAWGNTRALLSCSLWAMNPVSVKGSRGCVGLRCGVCRSAPATSAGVAALGTGGSCSLFQKLPFLFVVGRQQPGRGLTEDLVGRRGLPERHRFGVEWTRGLRVTALTYSLPWGRRVPCF